MRKKNLALLLSVLPLTATAAEFYTIDPTHTYPHFQINHLGFSTMHGRFDQTTGKIVMDRNNNNGSVDVKIAAVSVNTGFHKRDDHLRSPDFLNVMEYPEITYKSTEVVFKGDKEATVQGNLTLMGVTKPVPLNVTKINCGVNPMNKKQVCGFAAHAKIKRSDFGSNYGLPAIGDDMDLSFEVEAVKE